MTELTLLSPLSLGPASLDDVRVRPYGVGDEERLLRISQRLSRHSLYTRFFIGTPRLPDDYVRALRGLDHWDREAIVALLDDEIIGIADYTRLADRPDHADVAVLVADSWQRRGLARLLVSCLADLARRRRIGVFHADVLLENRQARAAIAAAWPAARPVWHDGSARFHLPLPRVTP
ncbi:hypothetical protein Arub01_31080 [Actinomadura rubrobrunea]|uniref:N-acetyltransferase domain-containing protein n=1 Tax=Actinomadura rubrobrunea TaxID=115335 RepID=A0A9W6UVB6_9ACTN|nr:GNAT family N-acetyltransferase [Actinomadura rubrobrunea]GLW64864.1 hypothetical protein Arub01_31080 [Actinomadura rubrobrunea]